MIGAGRSFEETLTIYNELSKVRSFATIHDAGSIDWPTGRASRSRKPVVLTAARRDPYVGHRVFLSGG